MTLIDCVGGQLTNNLLHLLPITNLITYGNLSGEPTFKVFSEKLIFGKLQIRGFHLFDQIKKSTLSDFKDQIVSLSQ